MPETIRVYSPPVEDLGPLPLEIEETLYDLAEKMKTRSDSNDPFYEMGRKSNRFVYGISGHPVLQSLANTLSELYLDRPLDVGSVGFHNVITDEEAFNSNTREYKAAASWHQEFVNSHAQTLPIPGDRFNWSTMIGTEIAEGDLLFQGNVIKLDTPNIKREQALIAGDLVVGHDMLLVKAVTNPIRGSIQNAQANRLIHFPRETVHRTPLAMPEGRQFFQVDIWPRIKNSVA